MTSLHLYHNNHGNMIENPDVGWSKTDQQHFITYLSCELFLSRHHTGSSQTPLRYSILQDGVCFENMLRISGFFRV